MAEDLENLVITENRLDVVVDDFEKEIGPSMNEMMKIHNRHFPDNSNRIYVLKSIEILIGRHPTMEAFMTRRNETETSAKDGIRMTVAYKLYKIGCKYLESKGLAIPDE